MTEESKKACDDFYANGHVQIGDRRVTVRWRGETVFDVRFNDDGTFDCSTGPATPETAAIRPPYRAYRNDDGSFTIADNAGYLPGAYVPATPEGDLISQAAVLAIFQPETSMVRKRICDDVRAIPAPQPQGEEAADEWLIHKAGRGWYRPNAHGYTANPAEAGRYSHSEALSYSHPNGWSGPRDGITIKRVCEVIAAAAPVSAGVDLGALIDKLDADSMDHIAEVIGAPRDYNQGKETMRQWFLRRLRAAHRTPPPASAVGEVKSS